MEEKRKRIKLSGLWAGEDKQGQLSLGGSLGSSRIVIYKNTFKREGSREPDYILYLEEPAKREGEGSGPTASTSIPRSSSANMTTPDDIPF